MVLWEILTREEPYQGFETFEAFRDAVCFRHYRPKIPDNTHPSIKRLIECCWQPNPERRPSFPEIITALDHIIVDCAIHDEIGRRIWKERFLNRVNILLVYLFILILYLQYDSRNMLNGSNLLNHLLMF